LETGAWYGNFVFPLVGLIVLLGAWVAKKVAAVMSPSRRMGSKSL